MGRDGARPSRGKQMPKQGPKQLQRLRGTAALQVAGNLACYLRYKTKASRRDIPRAYVHTV
jgi:hypothetical protein